MNPIEFFLGSIEIFSERKRYILDSLFGRTTCLHSKISDFWAQAEE
jgi:hypothetical protein